MVAFDLERAELPKEQQWNREQKRYLDFMIEDLDRTSRAWRSFSEAEYERLGNAFIKKQLSTTPTLLLVDTGKYQNK